MDSLGSISGHLNLITKQDLRLPPRGMIKFANMQIILSPYIEEYFCLNGVIGADNAAPKDFRIYIPKNKLRSFVAKALKDEDTTEQLSAEFFHNFLMRT